MVVESGVSILWNLTHGSAAFHVETQSWKKPQPDSLNSPPLSCGCCISFLDKKNILMCSLLFITNWISHLPKGAPRFVYQTQRIPYLQLTWITILRLRLVKIPASGIRLREQKNQETIPFMYFLLADQYSVWGEPAVPPAVVTMNMRPNLASNEPMSDRAYGPSIIIYHLS